VIYVVETPLTDAPSPPAPPSRFERACMFVPILGWIVAARLEMRRRAPKTQHIARQIAERSGPATVAAWGDEPSRLSVVRDVIDAIQRQFDWPSGHFLPGDRLDLLMWSEGGGMGGEVLFCLFDIERRVGVKLRRDDVDFLTLTLGQFVDYVNARRGKAARPDGAGG
jgi:hypothetical protein